MTSQEAIKTNCLISIAIATYNGEKYLREQLDSIYQQSFKNIEVVVTDDCSVDSTPQILEEYCQKYKLRYCINKSNLGFLKNFEKAISLCQGDYIALCDQDDVWIENKLEMELNSLLEVENTVGKHVPILIFSDLYVVNSSLKIISDSFYSSKHFDPYRTSYNYLLVENVVLGCTFLINRALSDIALPIPENAIYHDHWLVVVCSIFGQIKFLKDKTVYYRQHGLNSIGTELGRRKVFLKNIKRFIKLFMLKDKYFKLGFEQRFMLSREVSKLKDLPCDIRDTCVFFGNIDNFDFIQKKRNLINKKLLCRKLFDRIEMLIKL